MPVPKIPPKSAPAIRRREGVAGPRYLLAEIEELKTIADKGGLGTLAYLLERRDRSESAGAAG